MLSCSFGNAHLLLLSDVACPGIWADAHRNREPRTTREGSRPATTGTGAEVVAMVQMSTRFLGVVDSPFFPEILLFRKRTNTRKNSRFLKRTMVEKNGESTPRRLPQISGLGHNMSRFPRARDRGSGKPWFELVFVGGKWASTPPPNLTNPTTKVEAEPSGCPCFEVFVSHRTSSLMRRMTSRRRLGGKWWECRFVRFTVWPLGLGMPPGPVPQCINQRQFSAIPGRDFSHLPFTNLLFCKACFKFTFCQYLIQVSALSLSPGPLSTRWFGCDCPS